MQAWHRAGGSAADLLSDHVSFHRDPAIRVPRCANRHCGLAIAEYGVGARASRRQVGPDKMSEAQTLESRRNLNRPEAAPKQRPGGFIHAGGADCTRNDPRPTDVPAPREKWRQIGTFLTLAAPVVADTDVLGCDRERAWPPPHLHAVPPTAPLHPHVRVEERHAEHAFAAHSRESFG